MEIVDTDGTYHDGRVSRRGHTLTGWLEDGRTLKMKDIQSVSRTRTGQGVLDGLAVGAGVGVGFGVLVGFSQGDDPPCDHYCAPTSAGTKALGYGLGLGFTGALVGGLLGALIGHRDVYERTVRPPAVTFSPATGGGLIGVASTF